MLKKILLPTDYSTYAKNSLSYATALAEKTGAELLILHSYTGPIAPNINMPVGEYSRLVESERVGEIQRLLMEFVESFLEEFDKKHIPVSYKVIDDTPQSAIRKTIKEEGCDLVVMGTKGASGMEETFLGSITADIIESVKTPVLVVPRGARYDGLKNVVYATDFDIDDVMAVDRLMPLLKLFGAEIHCLHVNRKKNSDAPLKDQYLFAPLDKIDFEVVRDKSVKKGIDNYLNTHDTDLLVMLTHRRNFLERLFHRSKTRRMSFHSTVPLLVLKGI